MSKIVFWIKIALILSVFVMYVPLFSQPFHYPKILVLFIAASMLSMSFLFKPAMIVPSGCVVLTGFGLILLSWCSVAFSHTPLNSVPQCMLFLSAAVICITVCNFTPDEKRYLPIIIFFIALAEALLAYLQFFDLRISTVLPFSTCEKNVIGTMGNAEFLASFLAVGLLMGLKLADGSEKYKKLVYCGTGLISIAILLTENKGTLLFLGIVFVYFLTKKKFVAGAILLVSAGVALWFFPSQLKGRLLVWISSAYTFKHHLLTGTGIRQVGHYYLDSVGSLFTNYPLIKTAFGQNTGAVLDAHNIVLNFGVETGIIGLLLSMLFVVFVVCHAKKNDHYTGIALLFLVFKSLYTVMHNCSTSLILLALLLGVSLPVTMVKLTTKKKVVLLSLVLMIFAGSLSAGYLVLSDFWYKKGMVAITLRDLKKGDAYIRNSLAINPQNFDADLALGHLYFLNKDTVRMKPPLFESVKNFKSMNTLKISAHMFFFSEMHEEAEKLYLEIEKCYPYHLTTLAKLAQIYFSRKEYKKAYDYASSLLDCEPRVKNESDFRNKMIASEIINVTGPLLFNVE